MKNTLKVGEVGVFDEFKIGQYCKFHSGDTTYSQVDTNTKFKVVPKNNDVNGMMIINLDDDYKYFYANMTATFIRIRKPNDKYITNKYIHDKR